jgi:hypothetical protein
MNNFSRASMLGLSLLLLVGGVAAQQAQKPTPAPLPQFNPSPNDR